VTVAAVLALASGGTGASVRLSHLCRLSSQRRAADHQGDNSPTKVVPTPGDGLQRQGRLTACCPAMAAKRSFRAKEAPVDVNSRSGPRVVFSAAEPERQPATGRKRYHEPGRHRRALPTGTLPSSEPRKIKTLAVKGDAAENGGRPGGWCRTGKTGAGRPHGGACSGSCKPPHRLRVTRHPPTPMPARRCRCRRRARQRPIRRRRPRLSHHQSGPDGALGGRRISGAGFLAEERGRRPVLLSGAPETSSRGYWVPARRSSSAPTWATRASITAPWSWPFGSTEEAAQFCGN